MSEVTECMSARYVNVVLRSVMGMLCRVRRTLALGAILTVWLGLGGDCNADFIVANNPGPSTTDGQVGRVTFQPGEETHGQTFTPTMSGVLSTMDIEMRRVFVTPITPSTVIVSVFNTAGGFPTGPALTTQTTPFSGVSRAPGVMSTFDFTSAGINLVAGTEYAFDVATNVNGGSTSSTPLAVRYVNSETYSGGQILHNVGAGYITFTGDGVFTVRITPEPASLSVCGLGLMLAMARRRRRTAG